MGESTPRTLRPFLRPLLVCRAPSSLTSGPYLSRRPELYVAVHCTHGVGVVAMSFVCFALLFSLGVFGLGLGSWFSFLVLV